MPTYIRFIWVLLLLAVLEPRAIAQNTSIPELMYVHFDKKFYLAGEDLWYSVYFTNPAFRQSNIVHAELFDPDGKIVNKQMLAVKNDKAIGDFALSPNLKEGYYLFRVYTHWNLNFSPQEIYQKYIPVYEFASADREVLSTNHEWVKPSELSELPQQLVVVRSNKASYAPREDIQLFIETDPLVRMNVKASISILNQKFVDYEQMPRITTDARKLDLNKMRIDPNKKIEPEKDMYKSFKIQNPVDRQGVKSSFIAGYVRQTKQRIISQTDNGIVNIRFDAFYDSSVVQLFDANPFVVEYLPIVTEQPSNVPIERPIVRQGPPPLTPEVAQYIEFYKKRFHLNNLFANLSNMRAGQPELVSAKLTPTFTYKLDDYIAFESIDRFIKEGIKGVKIKKYPDYVPSVRNRTESDKLNILLQNLPRPSFYFKLYIPNLNHKEKIVRRNPLLIVNNYLTYNADAILRMDIDNLKTVELFTEVANLPMQFGPIGNYGVMNFETKDGETSPEIVNTTNNIKVKGFYLPRKFKLPPHQGFAKGVSRVPNLRPMIYWNPDLNFSHQLSLQLTFSANDVPGSYLVKLEGMLEDGTPVYSETIIKIEARAN